MRDKVAKLNETGISLIQEVKINNAMYNSKHPLQPLIRSSNGVVRFKSNAIVRYLLDAGPFDMNHLAMIPFSDEDREQFAQLIGYSLGGFADLSYVNDETYEKAEEEGQLAGVFDDPLDERSPNWIGHKDRT